VQNGNSGAPQALREEGVRVASRKPGVLRKKGTQPLDLLNLLHDL